MTQPLTIVSGPAAPLRLADVDTDVIIRIERLTAADQSQLGRYAFEALRYRDDGSDDPDFPLNRQKWRGAPILLAGPNFGCGSSREGAVTALVAMGLRVVIASSFGDIFYANCFQGGMLPIRLPEAEMLRLMDLAEASDEPFTVDLTACTLTAPGWTGRFEIDAMRREALLTGLDDVELTLRDADAITAWQATDRSHRPWIWAPTLHPEIMP